MPTLNAFRSRMLPDHRRTTMFGLLICIVLLSAPAAAAWVDATIPALADTIPSRGVSWVDFDGDGDLDLYIADNGANLLYRNDGEDPMEPGSWLFVDVAGDMGADLDNTGRGSVGVWGDYDNDGDPDLYLANDVGSNRLFRNDPLDPAFPDAPERTFVEVTYGDLGTQRSSQSAAWIDFDGDGDLDLYVCNRTANMLLRNDGADPLDDGRWVFVDVAPDDGTGAGEDGSTQSCAWVDFDLDGDQDLFLSNTPGANRLLRNDGDDPLEPGRPLFTDVAAGTPLADAGEGRGAAWADFDNDGDSDLYLANYGTENRLYRNDPVDPGDPFDTDRVFTEIAGAAGVADAGNTRGLAWSDFDNDGDLDLYIVNSDDGLVPDDNKLWRNDGPDGGDPDGWLFADVTDSLLAYDGSFTATAAWGDYDRDGDCDLYVANWNTGSPNRLLRNDAPDSNHWFELDLTGRKSNSDGIGAVVRVVAGGLSQIRHVAAGEGLMAQNSPSPEFGLGSTTTIDTLEIRWPSGREQILTEQAADRILAVAEPGPPAPTIADEPVYTSGTVNTLSWSDESAAGAVEYQVQFADEPGFGTILGDSGWIVGTSHEFTGLVDGQRCYFRVRARDAEGWDSRWSGTAATIQDNAPPFSAVEPMTDPQPGDPFSVPYVAEDLGSGVQMVELYWRFGGELEFAKYGTRYDGAPFLFTIPSGPGVYEFYTVAVDNLDQREDPPSVVDQSVTVLPPAWLNVAPADGSGVGSDGNTRGVAWGDYDADGRPDLYISNRIVWYTGADATNHLFHNDGPDAGEPGGWSFTDATTPPLDDGNYGQGVAWADYDGDGDLDLYQAKMQVNPNHLAPNRLYRNNGDGSFTDVAVQSGVDDGGSGRTVAWADYDMDGDIDLYVANDGANRLYRNDGEDAENPGVWLFTDVSPADSSGVGDGQYTMGCAWADFDNDKDPDLYTVDYLGGTNRLFRNDGEDPENPGEWIFTDVAQDLGVADTGDGLAAAWADFDNDGWLDLYVANNGPNRLYRSVGAAESPTGTPHFVDVTEESGETLTDGQYGTGVAWADFDNDGDLDFFLGNHWPDSGPEYALNQLFRNDGPDPRSPGDWSFVNVAPTNGTGVSDSLSTNGAAWADYDGDGDMDLYIANMTAGANKLFRNDGADGNGNHWLHLDLASIAANTAAIGARVRVVAGGVSQIREVSGGGGFLSQESPTLEFGLGAAAVADTVFIDWPNGSWQVLMNVAADQRLSVVEDDMTAVGDPLPQPTPSALALHQNYPNPFNPSTTIRFDLPTEQKVRLRIYAVDGSLVRTVADGVLPRGRHTAVWNGRDSGGVPAASGVYFYRLETDGAVFNRRMLLLK